MAKRVATNTKNRTSRSHKTKKRLEIKRLRLLSKGKKNNWDLNKILIELQIPKTQRELILSFGIEDREEIIVSLVKGTPMLVDESEEIPKKNFKFKSGRK
mgnify:CR=1 FL=1